MKIASWNVNSIRVRLDQVLEWLDAEQPDVLGLQEIKMPSEVFPSDAFASIGYHSNVDGQKTYNGVALLSKLPAASVHRAIPDFADDVLAFCYLLHWVCHIILPDIIMNSTTDFDYRSMYSNLQRLT